MGELSAVQNPLMQSRNLTIPNDIMVVTSLHWDTTLTPIKWVWSMKVAIIVGVVNETFNNYGCGPIVLHEQPPSYDSWTTPFPRPPVGKCLACHCSSI